MLKVEIDQNSGYCFGVEFAIQMAEDELDASGRLFCLGDIVHNDMEVRRLNAKGLEIVDRENLKNIKNAKVLIRAHGEPPETYKIALENNLELIDASCPVVLKLQNRVKHSYDKAREKNGQIVIYGKPGHAEIIGLTGQTGQEAIIVTGIDDLDKVDFNRPVTLYSQTTKSTKGFYAIKEEIEKRIKDVRQDVEFTEFDFDANDSICRQVSNREPQLFKFAQNHDVIVFVSGKKSSNGKALYGVCKSVNPKSYFIESSEELSADWFEDAETVGICGATSTPMWLMENVKKSIEDLSAVEEKV